MPLIRKYDIGLEFLTFPRTLLGFSGLLKNLVNFDASIQCEDKRTMLVSDVAMRREYATTFSS